MRVGIRTHDHTEKNALELFELFFIAPFLINFPKNKKIKIFSLSSGIIDNVKLNLTTRRLLSFSLSEEHPSSHDLHFRWSAEMKQGKLIVQMCKLSRGKSRYQF